MAHEYLQEGPQTKSTEYVRNVSAKFSGNEFQLVFQILEYLNNELTENRRHESLEKLFRNRTGSKILKDRFSLGCTDNTLAFIVLMRHLGLPTKYIEMIDRKWLTDNDKIVEAHVVAEVQINYRWYIVDPTLATVSLRFPKKYIIAAEGFDSWDIGITNENWKEWFHNYREDYQESANVQCGYRN